MAGIISIEANEYDKLIRQSRGLVVLDIWGSGCAPCAVIGNILVGLAEEIRELTVCKLNFSEAPSIAVELGVMGLPSLFLLKDGKVIKQHTGAITKEDLRAWILS